MISFEFNRAKMRFVRAKLLVTYFGTALLALSAWGLLQPHLHKNDWLRLLSTVLLCLILREVMVFLQLIALISQGLRKKTPAVVIDQRGVVDNASQFAFGRLTWDQIEKMYPWIWTMRLFGNRWLKMPVIRTEHGVVIVLKDNPDLRARIQSKSWLKKTSFDIEFARGRRWLFIPETVLPVTAKALMEQINTFYIAEVRGY